MWIKVCSYIVVAVVSGVRTEEITISQIVSRQQYVSSTCRYLPSVYLMNTFTYYLFSNDSGHTSKPSFSRVPYKCFEMSFLTYKLKAATRNMPINTFGRSLPLSLSLSLSLSFTLFVGIYFITDERTLLERLCCQLLVVYNKEAVTATRRKLACFLFASVFPCTWKPFPLPRADVQKGC